MANGIRTGGPRGLNKGRSLKFCEGSRVWQTPEEGRRAYRPKRCGNNNKDEDNSPKNLNDENTNIYICINYIYIYIYIGFVSFDGISTIVGYLMPNLVFLQIRWFVNPFCRYIFKQAWAHFFVHS